MRVLDNNRFLRALQRQPVDRTPVCGRNARPCG